LKWANIGILPQQLVTEALSRREPRADRSALDADVLGERRQASADEVLLTEIGAILASIRPRRKPPYELHVRAEEPIAGPLGDPNDAARAHDAEHLHDGHLFAERIEAAVEARVGER